MYLKGIFVGRPAFFQLVVLLLLVTVGMFLSSVITVWVVTFLYGTYSESLLQHPDVLRWMQLLTSISTFLLPALGTAWLCSDNVKKYLFVKPLPSLLAILLTIVCFLSFALIVNLAEYLNRQMVLPDFMGPVEQWMRQQENAAMEVTMTLLEGKGIVTLLFNLLVIAIVAGIAEEFLFRGALQRILGLFIGNHHWVIWIAAFIFSAIHLQFYGFIPRLLQGAFFGYLLYWSRNIWLPVFVHFLNNAIAVIGMSSSNLKDTPYFSNELADDSLPLFIIMAIIGLALFIPIVKVLRWILINPSSSK